MLPKAQMLGICAFTAATAALLCGFATADLSSQDADPSSAPLEATPSTTTDGWVQRELPVQTPMMVPAGVPFGPLFETGEVPSPELAVPKLSPSPVAVPVWVPKHLLPRLPLWGAPQVEMEPKAVDPGSLKTADRVADDANVQPRPPQEKTLSVTRTPPAAMIGVGVTIDSRKGTQVYEYRQGRTADGKAVPLHTRVYSSTQGKPGTGASIGVGISADSSKGVRVYRYYHSGGD